MPTLRELPKLTQLTLASAIGGGGGTGGGGSTVFGILLALFALAGCVSDMAAPSAEVHAVPQLISCRATVATGMVECSGPELDAPTPEIFGGQGRLVALRSSNVAYDGSAIFQADVRVQNLAAQTIGAPGGGIDVFFVSGPTVTGGTGAVTLNNPSGTGTFTAAGQEYFNYPDSVQTGATSSALTWKWNVPATVNTFAFTVEVSTEVEDVGGVLQWTPVPQFASDSFTGIAVNSATDAMAVGIHGATMHKVGGQWQRMPVQLNEDWVGVSAIGDGKYVGATLQGSVALFDGKVWKVLSNRGYPIHGVTAYAANRIAVGGANILEWYGDNGWYSIGFGGAADFTYFVSFDVDQGFGQSIDGVRCPFNFNAPTPGLCGGSFPTTAAYGWLNRGQGQALETGNQGFIYDFGASFLAAGVADTTYTALELGSGGPYLWAAAMSNTTGLSHLDSWTAGVWSEQAQLDHQVIRMVQDSVGGLYLLSADGIRHWNGSSVVDELVAPQASFPTAIGGGAGYAFVGMTNGDIRRFDGTAWTTGHPLGFGYVTTVLGFGATAAVAIDTTGRFAIYDGTTWNYKGTFSNSYRIWGVDTTHLVMLTYVAGTPIVRHGDLLAPTTEFHPNGLTTPLNAIWGTSDTDFWVAGNGGAVLYYNGTSYTANAPGTALDLRAITGTSNSDLWVAGSSGYIAHWDGASWTACTIGSSTITTLFSPRAGVVYVGTGATTDTLTAASCGARAIRIPGAYEPVTGLSGSSAEDLWAIVATRVYWGHR